MPRVKSSDRAVNVLWLISMWLGQDDRYLYASEIRKEAYRMGFSPKEVTRLFKALVPDVLEEVWEGKRTRKFKPTRAYWDTNFQWIPIGPHANEAEYLMLSSFVSEVTNRFLETSRNAIKQAPRQSVVRESHSTDQKELDLKIGNLISIMKIDISRIAGAYFNQKIAEETVYERLRINLIDVIKAYLDLWDFVMTTKGALWDFTERMGTLQKALDKS